MHSNRLSRRTFLANSSIAAVAIASGHTRFGLDGTETDEVMVGRFNGTVAIFYISHFQVVHRDWDSIEEYKGPYHPLLGYYGYKTKSDVFKHLKWLRRTGVDAIVYDVYGFAEWGPMDIEKDRVLKWMIEALADQEKEARKLKLIIWIEKYDSNPTLDDYRYTLNYLRKHIASRPFYFQLENKPLVLTYVNHDNPVLDQLERETHDFTLRRVRAYDGKENWSYVNDFPQPANHEWMPVSPGIDPFLEDAYLAKKKGKPPLDPSKWVQFDRQDGDYFKKQFRRAREINPDFIFLSGWNDWQYGLEIEPAIEYRFKYVDLASTMLGRVEETKSYRDEN